MSYKTILVHVDQSKHAAERIRIAARIALAENAHLIGTAMTGISRFIYEGGAMDPDDPVLMIRLKSLRERANLALTEFETLAEEMGVLSFEKRLVEDEAGGSMSLQARYCDLVVIGQADPEETSSSVMPDFPEYVVMNCGRPVLIVPCAGHFEQVGTHALVAWNASMEATRALTNAIPMLKRAQKVEVAILNAAAEPDLQGDQLQADIGLYLARHDINVGIVQKTTDAEIGKALLSMAQELSSDLIVMGGYGHSRFREILLGGATRAMLTSMTIPVLMSH